MRKNSRHNTHLNTLQDKLAYINAAEQFFALGALMHNLRLHEKFSMNNAHAVDAYYNTIEDGLKAAGLHKYVEMLRTDDAALELLQEFLA